MLVHDIVHTYLQYSWVMMACLCLQNLCVFLSFIEISTWLIQFVPSNGWMIPKNPRV